jgi:hypothetical protein
MACVRRHCDESLSATARRPLSVIFVVLVIGGFWKRFACSLTMQRTRSHVATANDETLPHGRSKTICLGRNQRNENVTKRHDWPPMMPDRLNWTLEQIVNRPISCLPSLSFLTFAASSISSVRLLSFYRELFKMEDVICINGTGESERLDRFSAHTVHPGGIAGLMDKL